MRSILRPFYFLLLVHVSSFAQGESVDWIRQRGTSTSDRSYGLSADALGDVFVSFETLGSLGGPNAGALDVALSKYDSSGNAVWTRQFGTPQQDESRGLSADGLGNVYISGDTTGNLAGTNAGQTDVFVRKYDNAGTVLWSQQFGTNMGDLSRSVSADGLGNVYVSGKTFGSISGATGSGPQFVRKYLGDGTLQWTTQFGDVNEGAIGQVSADKLGNVFGVASSFGTPANPNSGLDDAFVFKLDSTGAVIWKHAFGALTDTFGNGVVADGLGNVYISGTTYADNAAFLAGNSDVFVSKYDSGGNKLWTKLIGGPSREDGFSITTDEQDSVILAGSVNVPIGGGNFNVDAIVSKLDSAGNLIWTHQFSTPSQDTGYGMSYDSHGGIYTSGQTFGSLGGTNAGGGDAFVARISEAAVPEPSILLLAAIGAGCLPLSVRRRCF